MSEKPRPAPLTFPDADRSPLSIRAKALVFFDPRSHRVREELERLAPQGQPVLIEGETGTGKELLARQIHRHSERAGLFVAVSCSALSRNHAEAELFGYAPGAHNGPVGSRAGWFGSANGGTLYLDEIGDLPLTLQARLLQALEEREVLRVGAQQPIPHDVRLVTATSVDLDQAVRAGKFLAGLQQYLHDGRLSLPPLRERPGTSCRWRNTSSVSMPSAWTCRCRPSAWRPSGSSRAIPGQATSANWKTSSTSPCWSATRKKSYRSI